MKTNIHHSVEILESRIAPAGIIFSDLAHDLKVKLDSIQLAVDGALAAASFIPVVGDKIAAAGKVVDQFSAQLRDALSVLDDTSSDTIIQNAIFSVLGSPGLNILGEYGMVNGVTPADIVITHPQFLDGVSIVIDLNLHAAVALAADVSFDIGLKSLPIEVEANAGVALTASIDYSHLKFGYGVSGLYFDSSAANELQVNLTAGLKAGSEITATFGFLSAKIKDGTFDTSGLHTQLAAGLSVDVGPGLTIVSSDLTLTADIALQIDASASPNFPGIGADFRMHYSGFNATDAAPTVEFKNVRVNLGGAISGVIEPIFSKLEPILKPVKPIIDFITAPIPVISDLSNAIGIGDVSLLDIADAAAAQSPPNEVSEIFQIVSAVAKVVDFANDFKTNPDTKEISINFGDFPLMGAGGSSEDLRTTAAAISLSDPNLLSSGNLSNLISGVAANLDIAGKIDDAVAGTPLEGSALITELQATLDQFIHPNGIQYSFPFFTDPGASVFGMLVGRDADLFTLDAKLKVSDHFDQTYPIGGGISVGLAGEGAIDIELHLGYDTFGVRQFVTHLVKGEAASPADFLDGIYMTPTTHAHIDASIAAQAGIDLVVVSVTVEGGISLGVHLDPELADVKHLDGNDNKIHLRAELGDCIFKLTGGLDAFLDVAVKVGIGFLSHTEHFDIAHVNLLNFGDVCIPNPFLLPPDVHLATVEGNVGGGPDTLRLNIGTFASERNIPDDPFNPDENYQIFTGGKPGEVVVFAYGYIQTFSNVGKIIGDSDGGDDTIIFSSVEKGSQLTADVEISGGSGNDTITYSGTGTTRFYGGSGKDILSGGAGTNYLNGGDDADHITGGDGPNFLGSFTLDGGLHTDLGDDTIFGGKGVNKINGDDGNDRLFAGPTNGDILLGGRGDDQFTASTGTSSFSGEAGDDTISWKHGDGIPTLLDGGSDLRENNSLLLSGSDMADTFAVSKKTGDTQIRLSVATGTNAPFAFNAHAIHELLIEGGKGLDTITVYSLTGTPVKNVGINLSDVLGNSLGLNDNAVDVINVLGSFITDTVVIQAEQVVVSEFGHDESLLGGVMKVGGLQSYTVRLANVADDFTYNAGGGNDSTTILSNTGPTRLLGNIGNDSFTIAAAKLGNIADPHDPANPKDYISAVTVDGGAGTNKITFDETASELADTILFGQSQFLSKLVPSVTFVASGGTYKGGVIVKGGQFADTINLSGTLAAVTTSILSGAGDDIINIGGVNGSSGSLDFIQGPVNIDAGFGVNQLLLVDVNDMNGNLNVGISATQVLKLAGATDNQSISFAANGGALGITIEGSNTAVDKFTLLSPNADIYLRGNGGNDTVQVIALGATKNLAVSGGQGDDCVTLGTGIHKLDGFTSLVSFHGDAGSDTLTLDDAANLVQRNFDINAASFSFTGANGTGSVDADSALEIANVLGGKFGTTFHVKTSNVLVGKVIIDGTTGNDVVEGPDAASVWNVTNTNAGVLNGNVNFIRTPNLFGGSKSDRFVFANGKGVTGSILGDPGNAFGAAVADTLDYSAFTTGVTVNLKTGKASNVGGAISAIENVTGGLAGDVIVGNNIANIILGGAGRDVLIGGLGADAITAGADEDLLIGGTTDFDTDAVAIQAIAQAWRGAGDYLHRIAKLTTTGVGLGNAIKLTAGTVHNDLTTDTLFGGEDRQDWFFAHLAVGGPLPGIDVTDFSIEIERNG